MTKRISRRQVRPLPPYKIANRVIRLNEGADGTTWPWPFRDDDSHTAAWKARYTPAQLTQTDLFELASIADAYTTLITHPVGAVRATMGVLHRIARGKP